MGSWARSEELEQSGDACRLARLHKQVYTEHPQQEETGLTSLLAHEQPPAAAAAR
jgi:hypothetical protein